MSIGPIIVQTGEERADEYRLDFWKDLVAVIQKHERFVRIDDRIALMARGIGVMMVTLPDGIDVDAVLDSIIDDINRGNEAAWQDANKFARMPVQGRA